MCYRSSTLFELPVFPALYTGKEYLKKKKKKLMLNLKYFQADKEINSSRSYHLSRFM